MWGMASGPYEISPGRIMPIFLSTYTPNVNTVTQLSRTLRTLKRKHGLRYTTSWPSADSVRTYHNHCRDSNPHLNPKPQRAVACGLESDTVALPCMPSCELVLPMPWVYCQLDTVALSMCALSCNWDSSVRTAI